MMMLLYCGKPPGGRRCVGHGCSGRRREIISNNNNNYYYYYKFKIHFDCEDMFIQYPLEDAISAYYVVFDLCLQT